MGNENAERIQTSLLNRLEKKTMDRLVRIQPEWVTSDMMSYLGLFAAIGYAICCWLANCNVYFFYASSFFLALNWYGDGLDGTMARFRGTQRPKYGFFIDHTLDALTTCLFCLGLGLSPMMMLSISLFIMGGYLCMSIYTYVSTIVLGKFRLTYASLGPTEMRLIIVAVSILYIYFPLSDVGLTIGGLFFTVYDLLGSAVAAGLFIVYIVSMAKDLRALAKIDPPKPYKKP